MNIVVFVTTKDVEEAQKIAQGLLEKRLIACANIVSGVQSLFWWEGKIDHANETLLILKTTRARLPQLTETVKTLHSYSVPEVIALPIVAGNKDYLKWLSASVKK